ncbi:MAG: addiction module protein [Candidatus Hydrogenedentes bacterium]|nr:addiction module protein [Candidatus Hydrogenedentota bacterium]
MAVYESLKAEVLSLPASDRTQLIEDILVSFGSSERAAVDAAWVAEAESRLAAYDRGEMKATPHLRRDPDAWKERI